MKFLIKLLLILGVIMGIFFVYISTKPDSYDVNRKLVLKAPVTTIFNTVNDYSTWQNWGPWMEMDTTIVVTLDKKSKGMDAGYSWKSTEDGGGRMKTIALEQNKYINQKIYFDNHGEADIYWKFKPTDNGTEVIWGMKGELGLIEKAAFFVVGGPKLMFEPMLTKGLQNLDSLTQKIKKTDTYSFTNNGVGEYGGNYYVGLKATCSFEELGATLDKILPDVLIYCMKNGIKKEGPLFNLYHKYDEDNQMVEVSSCVPVGKKVKTDAKYQVAMLEKGKYHKTTFQGNYKYANKAWIKATEFVNKEGYTIDKKRKPFEFYVKGHTQSLNPEDWITEIYLPVK